VPSDPPGGWLDPNHSKAAGRSVVMVSLVSAPPVDNFCELAAPGAQAVTVAGWYVAATGHALFYRPLGQLLRLKDM
jgi:hypothetical protein